VKQEYESEIRDLEINKIKIKQPRIENCILRIVTVKKLWENG